MNTKHAAALRRLAFAVALCLGCAACVSLGKPFAFAGPGDVSVGKTTQKDLIAAYGRPFRVGFDNGAEKWAYAFYRYSLFGESTVQDLDIVFERNGTVSSYTYESTDPPGPVGQPAAGKDTKDLGQ